MTADEFDLDSDIEFDFRFVFDGDRPRGRTLGGLARQFLEDGGPPAIPRPTVGIPEGGSLPLLYPGLNAIAADSGVGKSMVTKDLGRREVRLTDPGRVLVLDCETTVGEYLSTLMVDFAMTPGELDRVHYATDVQRNDANSDRWSGFMSDELLNEVMDGSPEPPTLVALDSMSKSMALHGFDENRPIEVTKWYELMTGPLLSHWSALPAVVLIQARPKGWHLGMDVRQGRGTTALLHEVMAQYLLWQKKAGSRTVDGRANLVCTKDRYGHRVDGSTAAVWEYGPSGLLLREPAEEEQVSDGRVREVLLAYLADDPHDPELTTNLPPTRKQVVAEVAKLAKAKPKAVEQVLEALIAAGTIDVIEDMEQPGKRGARPDRIRLADESV